MPRLSLGLGVQTIRKVGGGGAPPSGIAYADAPATAISVINFTIFKENTFGDGNILYQFDEGINTPTNYYAYSEWNYESGIGKRAILAFNVNASTYYSNQSGQGIGDVTLSPNKWYLILFTAGIDVEGSIPPVPSAVYVNNSTGQSGSYIPTSGWSPTLTIQNGAYAADGVNFNFAFGGFSDQLPKFSNTNWANNYEEGGFSLTWNNVVANQWALNCDGAGTLPAARATSTNGANSAIVPLDGWSYTIGSGQAITLSPVYP
jgi:hypothetical protein